MNPTKRPWKAEQIKETIELRNGTKFKHNYMEGNL
jgi:hypothetical protein